MDEDFPVQMDSAKAPHESNEAKKLAAKEKTQNLIDKHFNNLLEPIGDDLESDEKLQAILDDESKKQPLLDHLKTVNEMSEEMLAPVKAHYNLATEIAQAEAAKKQAAIEEEFETAAMYKKKILQLKE